jgi:hypothetical protein
MAEGLGRMIFGDRVPVMSAGREPTKVNPRGMLARFAAEEGIG